MSASDTALWAWVVAWLVGSAGFAYYHISRRRSARTRREGVRYPAPEGMTIECGPGESYVTRHFILRDAAGNVVQETMLELRNGAWVKRW